MPYPTTITASALRAINRSAVLEVIRKESPIARATISRRLGLSLPTVMRIVELLLEEGIVKQHGATEWSGGRRRPLLEFNSAGGILLGIDIGGTKLLGVASDLGGKILEEVYIARHAALGEEAFNALVQVIDTLLGNPKLDGQQVRGIGIGAPGITLHESGIVKWANTLYWKDFPLKARLASRYNLPVMVENDVNLAALGELWFGAGQNARNLVALAVGTGIGAGIIIDRALYRGSNEICGEIGNFIPGREFLGANYQDFGALESVASGTGIAARANQVMQHGKASDVHPTLSAEAVFAAARQGQRWAQEVVSETVDYLAIAIANLAVAFDPDMIVLGGGVAGSADLLIEPILRRINGSIPILPELVVSQLGRRATVMGAIASALQNTLKFTIVHQLT